MITLVSTLTVGWWLVVYDYNSGMTVMPEKYENLELCKAASEWWDQNSQCIPDNNVIFEIKRNGP